MNPTVQPLSLDLNGAAISVQITPGASGWEVRVLLFRLGPAAPIDAADIDIVVHDTSGLPVPVLARSFGALAETGNASSTTANAVFRIAPPALPARLDVRWAGSAGQFVLT